MRPSNLLLLLLSAVILSGAVASAERQVPNRLLVKFHPATKASTAARVLSYVDAQEEGKLRGIGVMVLRIGGHNRESRVAEVLRRNRHVEFAEPDMIVTPDQLTPNDPYYKSQSHLRQINTSQAWTSTLGDPNMIVAVLDTGVNVTHKDLADKLLPGWNFYDNNADLTDSYGHGTDVVGIIGASSNNATGVASIAWNVQILPLKISAPDGGTSTSIVAKALTYAADRGARVANMSYSLLENSSTVSAAADYLYRRNGLLVVSAGNTGATRSTADNPQVLCVSGVDSTGTIYSWSSRGTPIDVCAPGYSYTTSSRGATPRLPVLRPRHRSCRGPSH